MTKRWKFLKKGFKSSSGNTKWKIGEWSKPIKNLELCENGYHCSKEIYQAFSYVQGEILAQVECKGKHESSDDKDVWETMKIIKAYKWQKSDSVALSIYAAELCINNFEKEYPEDKRPREAIEAAKRWLKNPTSKNASAAESAAWSAARSAAESAAWSARSAAWSAAESAAESAAWSAESAARSAAESARSAARSAAESAAWSARSAAWSAESAAWSAESAARSALIKKISKWMDKRLLVLEEVL